MISAACTKTSVLSLLFSMIVSLTKNVCSHSTRALVIIYPWEVTKLALLHRLYLSFGPADSYCEFLIRLDIRIENSCAVQKFSLATMEHLKGLGTLFYVIDPYSTMFEKISDLPHPDFMSKVLVQILQWYVITKKIPLDRENYSFNKNDQYFVTKYSTGVPCIKGLPLAVFCKWIGWINRLLNS